MSESQLVRATLDRLAWLSKKFAGRCLFWRQNAGSMVVGAGSRHERHVWLGPTGMPDIAGIVDGRSVWGEAKLPGKKPTDFQVAKHTELRKAGALVFVFTAPEEFLCEVELLLGGSRK